MGEVSGEKLDAFVSATTAFLRTEVPEVVEKASEEEISAFVRQGVGQAAANSISDPYLVQQYVLFMAWAGADLSAQPWAAAILSDTKLSPETKIFELEDYILSQRGSA
jgi:hypothetical protein